MSFITKTIRKISRLQLYSKHSNVAVYTSSFLSTSKNFSCNSNLRIKMFMEHENKYAYDIMRNRGIAVDIETTKVYDDLNKEQFDELVNQDWSKKSPAEIFEVFPRLGLYCKKNELCISNPMFDNYIDNLTDNLNTASNEELVSIFYALTVWPETPSMRTRNYIEVWVALDDVCLSKLNRLSFDEMHLFISLFYMLNVSKVSDFTKKSLDKLASKAKRLTPEQLVKTLFFVGIQRSPPYDMHNLEVEMEKNMSEFSTDDVAIMSMGFFKSKTPIRRINLVMQIVDLLIQNSKNIHEVSLAALLKIIRYSIRVPADDHTFIIYNLLDTLQYECSRLSVMCNVHLALIGSSRIVLHEGCMDSIAHVVVKNMSKARIKDLERLVLTYGTLRYKPKAVDNFFDIILKELRKPEREDEISKHGRSFACCIQYLGLLGLYPVDLMHRVLDKTFLQNTYGKHVYGFGKEALTIHNLAEIFCNGQQMKGLTKKEASILAKKYTDYVPSEDFVKQYNVTEMMIIDALKVLREIRGGPQFVVGDHILTHHQRGDIIVCDTPEGKPVPIAEHFKSNTFGLIRRPPDHNTWTVLVIAGRNSVISGTHTPTGPFFAKIRELRHLGYCANLVYWSEYTKLKTFDEKVEYFKRCINEAVNNIEL